MRLETGTFTTEIILDNLLKRGYELIPIDGQVWLKRGDRVNQWWVTVVKGETLIDVATDN